MLLISPLFLTGCCYKNKTEAAIRFCDVNSSMRESETDCVERILNNDKWEVSICEKK